MVFSPVLVRGRYTPSKGWLPVESALAVNYDDGGYQVVSKRRRARRRGEILRERQRSSLGPGSLTLSMSCSRVVMARCLHSSRTLHPSNLPRTLHPSNLPTKLLRIGALELMQLRMCRPRCQPVLAHADVSAGAGRFADLSTRRTGVGAKFAGLRVDQRKLHSRCFRRVLFVRSSSQPILHTHTHKKKLNLRRADCGRMHQWHAPGVARGNVCASIQLTLQTSARAPAGTIQTTTSSSPPFSPSRFRPQEAFFRCPPSVLPISIPLAAPKPLWCLTPLLPPPTRHPSIHPSIISASQPASQPAAHTTDIPSGTASPALSFAFLVDTERAYGGAGPSSLLLSLCTCSHHVLRRSRHPCPPPALPSTHPSAPPPPISPHPTSMAPTLTPPRFPELACSSHVLTRGQLLQPFGFGLQCCFAQILERLCPIDLQGFAFLHLDTRSIVRPFVLGHCTYARPRTLVHTSVMATT